MNKWKQSEDKSGPNGKWDWLDKSTLYIYCDGSDSYSDWVRNFQLRKRKLHDNVRVNRVDRKEALWVIRHLRQQIDEADIFDIRGHSRGSAIALQLAHELKRRGKEHVNVTVTASKPTGNSSFYNVVKPYSIAYRHKGDIVPFLPPWDPNLNHITFGSWQPFWKAHGVKNYKKYRID